MTQKIKFCNPNTNNFKRNIEHASTLRLPCIKGNTHTGKIAVIAGSGPTLVNDQTQSELKKLIDDGATLIACKQAIKLLHDRDYKIDYAVSMDPGKHIAQEKKIFRSPKTNHIIATSSDPKLFDYLKKETVILFNSACGLKNELELYNRLFENPICIGGGFNVVNRAASLAMYMDFDEIHLVGVDGGWREDESFYADGTESTVKKITMRAEIDGELWYTAPDMLASCIALVRLYQSNPGKIKFIGDTLPNLLKNKDNEFLDDCAKIE